MIHKHTSGKRFMALLLTLSMLLSLVPGMAVAAQTEGDATPQPEASAPLEDGTYSVPIYGFGNFTKNYGQLPQNNAYIYPTAILKVDGGQTKLTLRVAGFKNFEKPFIVKDEHFKDFEIQGKLMAYPVNRSELTDNPNLSSWSAHVTAEGASNNDYYLPSSEIVVETDPTVIDTMGYADITIPMENIEHDVIMRLFPKAKQALPTGNSAVPTNILLDIDESSARKLDPLPTEAVTTLYPYVEDGSQLGSALHTFTSEDTAFVQALFDTTSQNNVNVNTETMKATVTLKVKQDASVTAINEMTKRDIKVPNEVYSSADLNDTKTTAYTTSRFRRSIIDTDYEGSKAYDSNDKTLTLTYDLSSYNDMVFGKRIRVKTNDEKTYYAGIALTPKEFKTLSLESTEIQFDTDTFSVPEDAALEATKIETGNEQYAAIEKIYGARYKNFVAYDLKVKSGGNTISVANPGTLSIPVPQDWKQGDVIVKRIDSNGLSTTEEASITNHKAVIKTSKMGTWVVAEKADIDEMTLAALPNGKQDGVYNVPIAGWKVGKQGYMPYDEPSMANEGFKSPAKLVVNGDEAYLDIELQKVHVNDISSYMTKLWVFEKNNFDNQNLPTGDTFPANSYDYLKDGQSFYTDDFNEGTLNYYPKHIYFKLPTENAVIPVRVKVPVMDSVGGGSMEREAKLIVNYAKAVKTEESVAPAPIDKALQQQIEIAEAAIADGVQQAQCNETSWETMTAALDAAKTAKGQDDPAAKKIACDALEAAVFGLEHKVTITGGTIVSPEGKDGYAQGDKITVKASDEESFDHWEVDYKGTKFELPYSPETAFPMPARAVSVRAVSENEGGGAGGETIVPPIPETQEEIWSVPVVLHHEKNDGSISMGNAAIDGPAYATIDGNRTTYYVNFKPIDMYGKHGHLLDLWHYENGVQQSTSKSNPYTENGKTYYQTFTMNRNALKETRINVAVSVDAMGNSEPGAFMDFDWDNAKKVNEVAVPPISTQEVKPGVVENEDGSKTETVIEEDGTVVETTTGKPDGSTNEKTTKPDGTTIDKTTDKAGNIDEKTSKPDGTTIDKSIKTDGLTTETTTTKEGKVTAEVTVPEGQKNVKVTIPKKDLKPGEVAVITKADGTKEVIKKSVAGEEGLNLLLDENTKLEIVDNSKTFNDVKEENWANPAIDFVTSREIFNGTGDNTFAPEATMTRGMLVQVLYNFENRPEGSKAGDFGDVKDDAWFADAVAWAADNKIVAGVGDNSFAPEQEISREQLVTILYRYAGEPKPAGSLDKYSDASKVSSYAQDAMLWAVENGIVSGMGDNTLAPQGDATRAQVAQIMMNFCDFII